MPYFSCFLIIGEGSIHKTLANHDNGALNDYSLKIIAEMIGYQYFYKPHDFVPHEMNFNVSDSIFDMQRGQFTYMSIDNNTGNFNK